jgi:predicted Zn-dependent protease
MKRLALLLLVATQPAFCQDSKSSLDNFSPDIRQRFIDASQLYVQKDLDGALAKVVDLEKAQPNSALIVNFKGAILLDKKEYARAGECFEKAAKLDPAFWPARYNAAEIPFRQGNFRDARLQFEALLAEKTEDELFQYRIFLTYLLENDKRAAEDAMNKLPFPGNTPGYYYAHAVWEMAKGNRQEAERLMRGAAYVFPFDRRQPFAEPLEILGWISKSNPQEQQPEKSPVKKSATTGQTSENSNTESKSRMFHRSE